MWLIAGLAGVLVTVTGWLPPGDAREVALTRGGPVLAFTDSALLLRGVNPSTVANADQRGPFGRLPTATYLLPDGRTAEDSLATGIEAQEADQMPRPTGRAQLGSPDAALGSAETDR